MKQLKILFVALILIGSMAAVWVAQTRGQATVAHGPVNVYSVKFLCGTNPPTPQGQIETGPVKPGNYLTAINIHNPYFAVIPFAKKAVLMYSNDPTFQQGFEIPRPPGQLIQTQLPPDFGMEIDCDDIRQVLLKGILPASATGFIKGWVIIETPGKSTLDIVSVYTAHGFTTSSTTGVVEPEGFSLEIDRAPFTTVKD